MVAAASPRSTCSVGGWMWQETRGPADQVGPIPGRIETASAATQGALAQRALAKRTETRSSPGGLTGPGVSARPSYMGSTSPS